VLKPTEDEYVHGPRWYREPAEPRRARARKGRSAAAG
jgi:hypothetical protein